MDAKPRNSNTTFMKFTKTNNTYFNLVMFVKLLNKKTFLP